MRTEINKIVLFHQNQIGDLMFSLPALKALRERFPQARIVSLIRPYLIDLVKNSPLVDEIIGRSKNLREKIRLLKNLRNQKFDLAVLFSRSKESALYAFLSGAKERVGFEDSGFKVLLTKRIKANCSSFVEDNLKLVASLGAKADKRDYLGLIEIAEADKIYKEKLLQSHKVSEDDFVIVIAPGASARRFYKCWKTENFARLADELKKRYQARIIIVGSHNDQTEGWRIARLMESKPIITAGETSLGQLAALLERADIFIGVDSGPMHLAAALGTKVIALFGPTDPKRSGPLGKNSFVITKRFPCSPCSNYGCLTRDCMASIRPEDVLLAVAKIVKCET